MPTAMLRQFLFFQERLQVPFQARSPLLRDFMVQKIAALPSQADILTPAVWKHLLALCSTEQHGWTGLQLSAALVLRYAVTGLRYKHTKRTVFSPELSSSRAFVWKVTKGKDGQPFAVSLPSHVAPKWPLFQHLHYELRNWLGETAPFMPDSLRTMGRCAWMSARAHTTDSRPFSDHY